GEHVGIEAGAVAALIPLRRLGVDALEGFAPVFLDAEGHGEGEKLFEHFGRLDGAVETIGFDVGEEILEAEDALEGAGSHLGSGGHKPAEAADDGAGENSSDDKGKRLHAGGVGEPDATHNEDDAGDDAEKKVTGADTVRALGVVSVADQGG